MVEVPLGTSDEVLRFDHDAQGLPLLSEIETNYGTLIGVYWSSTGDFFVEFASLDGPEFPVDLSMTKVGPGQLQVDVSFGSGGGVTALADDLGIRVVEHSVTNCTELATSATFGALSDAAELFHGQWRNRGISVDTVEKMASIYGSIMATVVLPLEVQPCRSAIADEFDRPEGIAPQNSMCVYHETYDGCVQCCETEAGLGSVVCPGIWWIPLGPLACGAIVELTEANCEDECTGKPPGPGQGEACHYFNCAGVCGTSCPDDEIPGICADGLSCCSQSDCPFSG